MALCSIEGVRIKYRIFILKNLSGEYIRINNYRVNYKMNKIFHKKVIKWDIKYNIWLLMKDIQQVKEFKRN